MMKSIGSRKQFRRLDDRIWRVAMALASAAIAVNPTGLGAGTPLPMSNVSGVLYLQNAVAQFASSSSGGVIPGPEILAFQQLLARADGDDGAPDEVSVHTTPLWATQPPTLQLDPIPVERPPHLALVFPAFGAEKKAGAGVSAPPRLRPPRARYLFRLTANAPPAPLKIDIVDQLV